MVGCCANQHVAGARVAVMPRSRSILCILLSPKGLMRDCRRRRLALEAVRRACAQSSFSMGRWPGRGVRFLPPQHR